MEVETISIPVIRPPAGSSALPSIDLDQLDQALDSAGCPAEPGLFHRLLRMLGR
jgi:hypothetical protein